MDLFIPFKKLFSIVLLISLLEGCASYDQFKYITEEYEIPNQVYKADFNQTWQALIQIMKKYDLSLQNQEAGVLKTRWIDNTLELNFADSFGSSDAVKSARFKLIINIVKGFRGTREVAKVTVFKRQMVEHDFLQGWKVVPSDGILEKSILYRIDRIINIDNKLKAIDDQKSKEAEKALL